MASAIGRAVAESTSSGGPAAAHLAWLDGLRGVAILMVVAVHSSYMIEGLAAPVRDLAFYGVRGVQLFFIVSGFTLMLNHAGKALRTINFAARRFFRIAPMFYAGAALYLGLAWTGAMALPAEQASAGDIAATLLFIHGWVPSALNTVVPGGWSIAAEAMFYCCFPALLLLAGRPRLLGGTLLASFVLAAVVSIALRRLPGPEWLEMARYMWPVQLPAFVGGCWLASLARQDVLWRTGARAVLLLAVVGMLVDSQLRGRSNQLVAVMLLLAFVWAAVVARPRLLEHPVLVLVGQVSFSLYILHFAVLGMLAPFAHSIEGLAGAEIALLVTFAAALAIAGGLAWCTYRWVELPAIAFGRRFGRPAEPA